MGSLGMARKRKSKPQFAYAMEEAWLREYALFYGTTNVTRFSERRLHGVSLTQVFEALANVTDIQCDKCDGPGTVCEIVSTIGDDQRVRVTVQFDASQMTVSILEAEEVEGSKNDEPDCAA